MAITAVTDIMVMEVTATAATDTADTAALVGTVGIEDMECTVGIAALSCTVGTVYMVDTVTADRRSMVTRQCIHRMQATAITPASALALAAVASAPRSEAMVTRATVTAIIRALAGKARTTGGRDRH